jgi:hypothetical protein
MTFLTRHPSGGTVVLLTADPDTRRTAFSWIAACRATIVTIPVLQTQLGIVCGSMIATFLRKILLSFQ